MGAIWLVRTWICRVGAEARMHDAGGPIMQLDPEMLELQQDCKLVVHLVDRQRAIRFAPLGAKNTRILCATNIIVNLAQQRSKTLSIAY